MISVPAHLMVIRHVSCIAASIPCHKYVTRSSPAQATETVAQRPHDSLSHVQSRTSTSLHLDAGTCAGDGPGQMPHAQLEGHAVPAAIGALSMRSRGWAKQAAGRSFSHTAARRQAGTSTVSMCLYGCEPFANKSGDSLLALLLSSELVFDVAIKRQLLRMDGE